MIPFCLFQCNSNRMSAAAFGQAQALSAACPARPRSQHVRRALAAPTRRCAVTDDTPLQMLHRHRCRCAVTTIRRYRCHTTPDAAPPSTLHRHRRRCAVPTIRCHRRYTATDTTPPQTPLRCPDNTLPQMLHHPRRYTALAAAPSRRYAATDATPPPMLHHPRRCAATDATPPRYYALPLSPLASHTQYDIDPMK